MADRSDASDKTGQVREHVFRAILQGEYALGERIPTEREMARGIGVSRVTVRRAYGELAAAGIVERRRRCGTTVAQTLRGHAGRSDLVGLLANVRDPFILDFVAALEEALAASGRLLVLKLTEDDPREEERAAVDLMVRGVRALVCWPSGRGYPEATFARLRVLGMNLVFFDRVLPGAIADFVGLDNRDAVEQLVAHAVGGGRSELLFLSHSGLVADSERLREEAFREACARHGVAHRLERVPWRQDAAAHLGPRVRGWLARPRCAAVLCVNDALALAARAVLPAGVGLYGIDGMEAAAEAGVVSVRQPIAKMADRAVRLLAEQASRGPRWKARTVSLPGTLVPAS